MKKTTFLTLLVIMIFGFLLTGCQQQDDSITVGETTTPSHQSLLKSSEPISEKDFYQVMSGRTEIATGVKISDYVKRKILFEDEGLEQVAIDLLHPKITEDDLKSMEIEAENYKNSKSYNSSIPYPRSNEAEGTLPIDMNLDYKTTANSSNNSSMQKVSYSLPPHVYEFNSENPNQYYWCGHANLKSVGMYHGITKSMATLHSPIFWNNSVAYRNGRCVVSGVQRYCAQMLDLLYAAKLTNNGGYGWSATTADSFSSILTWYQKLKDGVDYQKPGIVASTYIYGVGHFYTIIGYSENRNSNGSVNYDNSYFILRDNALSTPSPYGERTVSINTFYNKKTGNQILVVRP